jgi:glycosyltransferase involved in cell wall biosynthesis
MTIIAPEAACCKKPILYTNSCDFPDLAENGGGLEVDPSVNAIQKGLEKITQPHFNRKEMGLKGYNYVVKNFKWTELIKRYVLIFQSSIKEI